MRKFKSKMWVCGSSTRIILAAQDNELKFNKSQIQSIITHDV